MPQDTKYPSDKRVGTNIGEFLPGEVRTLTADQEKEGRRLIANGDFIEAPDAPAPKASETSSELERPSRAREQK